MNKLTRFVEKVKELKSKHRGRWIHYFSDYLYTELSEEDKEIASSYLPESWYNYYDIVSDKEELKKGISILKNRVITEYKKDGYSIMFQTRDGLRVLLHHVQECCESFHLEDITGDLDDLIGAPLLMIEESTNRNNSSTEYFDDSQTWTFYKLATSKGYVTLRFIGSSNGYYSESVDILLMHPKDTLKKVFEYNYYPKGKYLY